MSFSLVGNVAGVNLVGAGDQRQQEAQARHARSPTRGKYWIDKKHRRRETSLRAHSEGSRLLFSEPSPPDISPPSSILGNPAPPPGPGHCFTLAGLLHI